MDPAEPRSGLCTAATLPPMRARRIPTVGSCERIQRTTSPLRNRRKGRVVPSGFPTRSVSGIIARGKRRDESKMLYSPQEDKRETADHLVKRCTAGAGGQDNAAAATRQGWGGGMTWREAGEWGGSSSQARHSTGAAQLGALRCTWRAAGGGPYKGARHPSLLGYFLSLIILARTCCELHGQIEVPPTKRIHPIC